MHENACQAAEEKRSLQENISCTGAPNEECSETQSRICDVRRKTGFHQVADEHNDHNPPHSAMSVTAGLRMLQLSRFGNRNDRPDNISQPSTDENTGATNGA